MGLGSANCSGYVVVEHEMQVTAPVSSANSKSLLYPAAANSWSTSANDIPAGRAFGLGSVHVRWALAPGLIPGADHGHTSDRTGAGPRRRRLPAGPSGRRGCVPARSGARRAVTEPFGRPDVRVTCATTAPDRGDLLLPHVKVSVREICSRPFALSLSLIHI